MFNIAFQLVVTSPQYSQFHPLQNCPTSELEKRLLDTNIKQVETIYLDWKQRQFDSFQSIVHPHPAASIAERVQQFYMTGSYRKNTMLDLSLFAPEYHIPLLMFIV